MLVDIWCQPRYLEPLLSETIFLQDSRDVLLTQDQYAGADPGFCEGGFEFVSIESATS